MKYQVKIETIREAVIAEVSKLAASAYSDDGSSQYDGAMIYSSDVAHVDESIRDALKSVIVRMPDIATVTGGDEGYDGALQFNVPDLATENEPWITRELDRYLTMYTVASWLQDRLTEKAPIYTTSAVAHIDNATMMLKTRKTPTVTINGD